jgi:hypothetical protein
VTCGHEGRVVMSTQRKKMTLHWPDDPYRARQLSIKVDEYFERLRVDSNSMATIFKIEVGVRLRDDKSVDALVLERCMKKLYGKDFDLEHFWTACYVLEDYCLTGGAHVSNGTGLVAVT